MDLSAVATALADLAGTVTGLTAYDYVPGAIVAPCATVVLRPSDYRVVIADLAEMTATFEVSLYAPAGHPRDGLHVLYGYLSSEGASSVPAAVTASPTLGLAGVNATVATIADVDRVTFDDGSFYVGRITVEVVG